MSEQAGRGADQECGWLIDWLEQSGRLKETDGMVVSDHGYSTISGAINVEAALREAGFPTLDHPGGVAVANNGGSALFYTHNRDPSTADNLAQWLMSQSWSGAIVAADEVGPIAGTLPASLVGDQGPRVPEISMSFKWNRQVNEAGYPGQVYSTGGAAGQGQHGAMSRQELSNVLLAWGPSFKRNCQVSAPSGNIDITPTVLRILGYSSRPATDGRILEEALTGGPRVDRVEWSRELHNAERMMDEQVYRQQIKVSMVGDAVYVDEGSSTLGTR